MDHWDMEFEQTLADSEALLKNAARSMDDGTDYSLDSILGKRLLAWTSQRSPSK